MIKGRVSCFQFEPACAPPPLITHTHTHKLQPLPLLRADSLSHNTLAFCSHNLHPRRKNKLPNESLVRCASFRLNPFIRRLKNAGRIWLWNKAPVCHMHTHVHRVRYYKVNCSELSCWLFKFTPHLSSTKAAGWPRTMSRSFWANEFIMIDFFFCSFSAAHWVTEQVLSC